MNVCIVGLGLIGGTYAHALSKSEKIKKITAIDTDLDSIKFAINTGIISDGGLSDDGFLKDADLVIISLYPTLIRTFLEDNINNFKNGAIITDAAGIKSKIYDDIKNIIPNNVDFILGHPMAGREKTGVVNSDPNIFLGANYILTPVEKNKLENIEILKEIILGMGFNSIVCVTPEEHDKIIAFTSQLTHIIAVALVNSDLDRFDTSKFKGDSYRDLTRIAKINSALWSELFLENRENLLETINDFEKSLTSLKLALENKDKKSLELSFTKSTIRREKLDKKPIPDSYKVAFQGVEGSFSYSAMKTYFSDLKDFKAFESFEEVFNSVESGEFDYGVIPFENSTTGAIKDNYNLIREKNIYIVGEICIPISHNILGIPGSKLEDITEIYSHPQGFEQSSIYLKDRNIKLIPYKNTALSARYVSECNNPNLAAIASIEAGELYGLIPLAKNINHNKNNNTRFIIISKKLEISKDANKISLVLSTLHKPGALVSLLSTISDKGINMLNISSFPILEKPWEYFFYIDINGNLKDRNVQELISEIEKKSNFLKILGNYS